jgi:solute carrier family 50 protein (sugar transporter)
MGRMVMGVIAVFGTIAVTCFCASQAHKHKRVIVGTAGIVSTAILYASPLSIIRLVIQTKSVEFMPSFYFSLFIFLGSASWIVYGALSRDIIIMAPNFLGTPLGFGQMVLYCIYRDIKSRPAEDTKVDEDKQLESTKEKSEEDRTSCTSYDMEMELKV